MLEPTGRRARRPIDDEPAPQAVLLDWDGCCAFGDQLVPAALAFIRRHAARVCVVSNNSTELPADFADRLVRAGAPLRPDQVFLAGTEAIDAAARRGGRTLVLGNRRLTAFAESLGVQMAGRGVDQVVLLRDTALSYDRLAAAANALRAGARLIVANPDGAHPTGAGEVAPETGALLAALSAMVELDPARVEMVGKPDRRLFMKACRRLNVAPAAALMVGDNPATDLAGAAALGMPGLLADGPMEAVFETVAARLRTA